MLMKSKFVVDSAHKQTNNKTNVHDTQINLSDLLFNLGSTILCFRVSKMENEPNKKGRPKGIGRSRLAILTESTSSSLAASTGSTTSPAPIVTSLRKKEEVPSTLPKPISGIIPDSSTMTRPIYHYYILGKAPSSLVMSKLPKSGAVLGRLLMLLESHSLYDASRMVTDEVKAVWLNHFGPKLVLGKEFGKEHEEHSDEKLKIVKTEQKITEKIVATYKKWRNMEGDSRRPDRAIRSTFLNKQKQLSLDLDMPLDISKLEAGTIIQASGLRDWREEAEYLTSQLTREQNSSLGRWDQRQKKKDDRILKVAESKEATAEKEKAVTNTLRKRKRDYENENKSEEVDENSNDKDFVSKETRTGISKIAVMTKISLTCDARNISIRDRTVVAASVANALGVDIDQTDISKSTAWRNGQKIRLEKAKEIMDTYVCPDRVVVHWDGKTLTLRGHINSIRVCIYLSGVDAEKTRKLLGIPETSSGKGVDEFEIVKEHLIKWHVKKQLVGMVFDTTASNTGEHSGACRYLEAWVDSPILWLACRRHVAELHLGSAVKHIMGVTKDPGVAMYRRLRDQFRDLEIDCSNLVLPDFSNSSPELQLMALDVRSWAEEMLANRTFPRDDYKEFMELVVVSLGGKVDGFTFKLPGPDHHARWMSKVIYNLKIKLLSNIFVMTDEEKMQVDQVTDFVILFYTKYWFTTPLASSAARHDLDFMCGIHEYRKVSSSLSFAVLCSTYRHLWYLTPELITLALADTGLEDSSRESMARELYSMDRNNIKTGKPTFPMLSQGPTMARKNMSTLIGVESWLVFDLLDITGAQEWLLTSASTWHLSPSFLMLKEFACNIVVINDLAERGVHLATDFIRRVDSEEQREALFQVVEDFRSRVKKVTKASLKMC